MGKFGIGARVRDEDGDEGVIVEKRKGERLVRYDPGQGYSEDFSLWQAKGNLVAINDDIPATAPAAAPETEPASDGRFKVGDRVRLLTDEGEGRPAGSVGTAVETKDYYGEGVLVSFDAPFNGWKNENGTGHCWFCRNDQISAIIWQPKVGDRVQVTYGHGWSGEGEVILTTGSSANVRMDSGDVGGFAFDFLEPLPVAAEAQGAGEVEEGKIYRDTEGKSVGPMIAYMGGFIEVPGDGRMWRPDGSAVNEHPALVLTAAPFTIQAGKYYRTRDGRKVGPAEHRPGSSQIYPMCDWVIDGVLYQDDGTFAEGGYDEYDLVAEWPSEDPVAVAPATATPIKKRDLVTLARPAMVTGFDPNNPSVAHVVLGTGGTYTLPVAALVAAA